MMKAGVLKIAFCAFWLRSRCWVRAAQATNALPIIKGTNTVVGTRNRRQVVSVA